MQSSSAVGWKWVKFECHADPGSEVFVGGAFNRWKPSGADRLRDKRHDGSYRTLLQLKTGRHEYRFLVNGTWRLNPDSPVTAPGNDTLLSNVMDVV